MAYIEQLRRVGDEGRLLAVLYELEVAEPDKMHTLLEKGVPMGARAGGGSTGGERGRRAGEEEGDEHEDRFHAF